MHSGYIRLIAGDHKTYENSDIQGACNHLTIRRMAAWRFCGERTSSRQFSGLNSSGFLPNMHLLRSWCIRCSEMMLERIDRETCRIIRMSDSKEIIVTTHMPYEDFDGKAERYLNVGEFFRHKIRSFKNANATGTAIFSDDGDENKVVMFGGRFYANDNSMDDVWAEIQSRTGRMENHETTYENQPPFGSSERGKLVVRVNDFTDQEAGILCEPLLDESGEVVKKRKQFVDWEHDIGLSAEDIADVDAGSKNDHREVEQSRGEIVQVKS